MSEKKLALSYPIMTTYPQETNLISIVSMHEQFAPWFHSNFIQLKCSLCNDMDLKMYPDNFQRVCPLLEYQLLSRRSLGKWFPDIVHFVMKCIDDDLFFQVTVNSYYISAYTWVYKQTHRFHELLIFGYDTDLEVLYCADFFGLKYEFKAIPFAEFAEAYNSIERTDEHELDINNHLSGIELMRFNPRSHFNKKSDYLLDVGNIVELLGDYVYSLNTSKKYTVFENALEDSYGMKVYNFLFKHIELVLSGEVPWCNVRSFHIFYEHKKCMVLRMKYLCDLGIYKDTEMLLERVKTIEQQSFIIRSKIMKFTITGDKMNIMNINELLKKLALYEKETLSKLHDQLSKLVT